MSQAFSPSIEVTDKRALPGNDKEIPDWNVWRDLYEHHTLKSYRFSTDNPLSIRGGCIWRFVNLFYTNILCTTQKSAGLSIITAAILLNIGYTIFDQGSMGRRFQMSWGCTW